MKITRCFSSGLSGLIRAQRYTTQIKSALDSSSASTKSGRFSKKVKIKASERVSYIMAHSLDIELELAPLRQAVKEIGDRVRQLKLDGAQKHEIDKAVIQLKAKKKVLEERELELAPKELFFDRLKLEDLLKRRFFYDQSFSIYGGVSGLYDFGPMGCALKANMIQKWRRHFILAEGMLEVECSALTPEPVLKASGHVERFSDFMCKDLKTGECLRTDHLIKENIETLIKQKSTKPELKSELENILARLDGYDDKEMDAIIKKYGFKSPITGNDLSEPVCFNLMFPTQIGPTGDFKAYLRPETAQGIFINFKRLLEFNQGRLPFAAAQIGSGFRNEISPRQGLIRVREFTMCEIEHFVDKSDKSHPKFDKVKHVPLSLFSACNQMDGKSPVTTTIGEAVCSGVVANETLGYYMARTLQFLVAVGVDPKRLRFRQHMSNEMAHYANDCWDAECLTSYGWIECVGNADRACYDLDCHAKATNTRLSAEKKLDAPVLKNIVEAVPKKAVIGKQFKSEAKELISAISQLNESQVDELEASWKNSKPYIIAVSGKDVPITQEMVQINRCEKLVHTEDIVPSVIEPSFGIGRVMYVVLEHAFRQRENDEKRVYLELPPEIAPIKCSILPISANKDLEPVIEAVAEQMAAYELSYKVDDSTGSIGRRYARTDEIGIPFGITIDFESKKDDPWTVTLRHAPTMQQIRLHVGEVGNVVEDLVKGRTQWSEVITRFPIFQTDLNEK